MIQAKDVSSFRQSATLHKSYASTPKYLTAFHIVFMIETHCGDVPPTGRALGKRIAASKLPPLSADLLLMKPSSSHAREWTSEKLLW
jgi:hypothetical protein